MADVAIVTANFSAFDQVREQAAQDVDIDWICITDGDVAPEPWTTIKGGTVSDPKRSKAPAAGDPSSQPTPTARMAAKLPKLCPWKFTDAQWAVWIDANTEITSPTFAREALERIRDGVAVFKHPRRECIYAEAQASVGSESQNGKYDPQAIAAQIDAYRAEGHPRNGGLYACGVVAWDLRDPYVRQLGWAWLSECERFSPQDQLSLPVVARRLKVKPGIFGWPQLERRFYGPNWIGNRCLRLHPHL